MLDCVNCSNFNVRHNSIQVVVVLGAQALQLLGGRLSLIQEELDLGCIRLHSLGLLLALLLASAIIFLFLHRLEVGTPSSIRVRYGNLKRGYWCVSHDVLEWLNLVGMAHAGCSRVLEAIIHRGGHHALLLHGALAEEEQVYHQVLPRRLPSLGAACA